MALAVALQQSQRRLQPQQMHQPRGLGEGNVALRLHRQERLQHRHNGAEDGRALFEVAAAKGAKVVQLLVQRVKKAANEHSKLIGHRQPLRRGQARGVGSRG